MFNKKEVVQMLPKDLLGDLEKGDRTKEFMMTDVVESAFVDRNDAVRDMWQRAANAWGSANWGGLGQALGTPMQGLAQQQALSNQGWIYTGTSNNTTGGWK